jgi:hypothetical protein
MKIKKLMNPKKLSPWPNFQDPEFNAKFLKKGSILLLILGRGRVRFA